MTVDLYAREMDGKLLAGMQFVATFFISIMFALLFEDVPATIDSRLVIEFGYLIIFATLFAQLLFTYGMKYVSSEKAGMIFLLESVSAMVLGIFFLKETVYLVQAAGSVLIIMAIVIQDRAEKQNN